MTFLSRALGGLLASGTITALAWRYWRRRQRMRPPEIRLTYFDFPGLGDKLRMTLVNACSLTPAYNLTVCLML